MNNIRKDTTSNRKNIYNNWVLGALDDDARSDVEVEKQAGLVKYYTDLDKSNNTSEKAEAMLNVRIARATEGDTAQARTQERIKNFEVENRVAEIREGRQGHFTEEDLASERRKFTSQYKSDVSKAIREAGNNG